MPRSSAGTWDGEERVHAVLVLEDAGLPTRVVRDANAGLGDHQRVWSTSVWPARRPAAHRGHAEAEAPRAAARGSNRASRPPARPRRRRATVRRRRRALRGGPRRPGRRDDARGAGPQLARAGRAADGARGAVPDDVDEGAFADARTVGDLRGARRGPADRTRRAEPAARGGASAAGRAARRDGRRPARRRRQRGRDAVRLPVWNRRGRPGSAGISLPTWILPLGAALRLAAGRRAASTCAASTARWSSRPTTRATWTRRSSCWRCRPWRYRLAIAMAKEFFKAHFFRRVSPPEGVVTNSLNYYLSSLFFNAFPLPQREAGTRQTLRYIGELLGEGYSILIFPEGQRTRGGRDRTRSAPGVGMIGARLGVPVVPVRLIGLDRCCTSPGRWPTPGRSASRSARRCACRGGLCRPGDRWRGRRDWADCIARRWSAVLGSEIGPGLRPAFCRLQLRAGLLRMLG